jgi:hypothetical protein
MPALEQLAAVPLDGDPLDELPQATSPALIATAATAVRIRRIASTPTKQDRPRLSVDNRRVYWVWLPGPGRRPARMSRPARPGAEPPAAARDPPGHSLDSGRPAVDCVRRVATQPTVVLPASAAVRPPPSGCLMPHTVHPSRRAVTIARNP